MTEKEMLERERILFEKLTSYRKDREFIEIYLTETIFRILLSLPVADSILVMNDGGMIDREEGIIRQPLSKIVLVELESSKVREKDGFVSGQKADAFFRGEIARRIADGLLEEGFRVDVPETSEELRFHPTLWNLRFDVTVEIRGMNRDDIYPVEKEFCGIFDEEKYSYRHYPIEEEVAECAVTILKKLELLSDMGIYYRLYEILGEEPLEGRRIQDVFRNQWGRAYQEKTRELFVSYREYPYMMKKWNRYKKKQNLPEWEEVYDRISTFLLPVWDAEAKGVIFLDSWMPDLGRYL